MTDLNLSRLMLLVLGGLLIGLSFTGCAVAAPTAPPAATATPQPTVPVLSFLTPSANPTALPSSNTGRSDPAGMPDPMDDDPFALGEYIFTNGTNKKDQLGCQYCHGVDGKGNIGPDIRGKTSGDIRTALETREAMTFLRLNESEVNSVAEYLKWLAEQP